MEETLTLYPSPRWRLLSSTFHLIGAYIIGDPTHSLPYEPTTAVVVLAFCLALRQPFRILPKPHTLKLDTAVALQRPGQHVGHQSRPPPALPPLHKSIPPLKAITSSLRAKISAFRVVTTFTRFTSWATIFTSLAFTSTVAIFGTGVGLDQSSQSLTPMTNLQPTSNCQSAIYASVTLYVLSKVMHETIHAPGSSNPIAALGLTGSDVSFYRPDLQIFVYMFLIERVHVVSYAGRQPPRLSTSIYRFGLLAICVYIVIFALMIHGRVVELSTPAWFLEWSESRPEIQALPTPLPAVCTIGLKVYAAIPLLVYDVIASIALTVMFVVPLVTVGRIDLHSVGIEQNSMPPEATSPHARDNLDTPATAQLPSLPNSQKARASSNTTGEMEDESISPQWSRVHRERLRSLAKKSCL